MAKIYGPLMSMEASGGFAGAIVFGKWKGRNVAHQLVVPANPHSSDQEDARNRVRLAGAIQHHVNLDITVKNGKVGTDKARLIAKTPAGYAWNGWLTDTLIGSGAVTYTAMLAAWAALQAGEKTAWDTAAAALTPAYAEVYQTQEGGTADTSLTAGNAFFAHQYALSQALGDAAPGAVPPTYA